MRFFSQKKVHLRYSTTVPAKRHEVNSQQLFQKIGQKVAGSTHAAERIGSLWNALLQGTTKARGELRGEKFNNAKSIQKYIYVDTCKCCSGSHCKCQGKHLLCFP